MVISEALDIMIQCVDPARGKNPCLAKTSAKELTQSPRLGNSLS